MNERTPSPPSRMLGENTVVANRLLATLDEIARVAGSLQRSQVKSQDLRRAHTAATQALREARTLTGSLGKMRDTDADVEWVASQGVPSDVAEPPDEDPDQESGDFDRLAAVHDVCACATALAALRLLAIEEVRQGNASHFSGVLWEMERVLVHMTEHLENDLLPNDGSVPGSNGE